VPRDSSVTPPAEVSRWMLVPMGVHAVGVIVLGVLPLLGFKLVQGSTVIALESLSKPPTLSALKPIADTLTWIGAISGALVLSIELLLWLRSRAASSKLATSHLTWGCGYGAPTPRMQYTGSSFSSDFSARFRGVMVMLRRQKAPTGYFPTESYLITDCVDAVERRLFSVIGHGDASAGDLSRRLREDDPRIAFAAALIGIVVIAGVLVLASGPLR
jgi:hydrogenase-4 component B